MKLEILNFKMDSEDCWTHAGGLEGSYEVGNQQERISNDQTLERKFVYELMSFLHKNKIFSFVNMCNVQSMAYSSQGSHTSATDGIM